MKYFLLLFVTVVLMFPAMARAQDLFSLSVSREQMLRTLEAQRIIGSAAYFRPEELLGRAEALTMILRSQTVEYVRDGRLLGPWTDIPEGAWYTKTVMTATQLGVVQTDQQAAFVPERPVTRGEFLVMLYRLRNRVAEIPDRDRQAGKFADVHPTDWYFVASSWAKATFLAGRVGPGAELAPAAVLTRQEAASWIYAYWTYYEGPSSDLWMRPFGDIVFSEGHHVPTRAPITAAAYTGASLAYLDAEAYVYKEVMPRTMSRMSMTLPTTLSELVPFLRGQMFLQEATLVVQRPEGGTLAVEWNPAQDLLRVALFGTGSRDTLVTKDVLRFVRSLGIDTRRLESPEEWNDRYLHFPKVIDGVPVYTMDGARVPELLASTSEVRMSLRQLALRGLYRARPWEDVRQSALNDAQTRLCPQRIYPNRPYAERDPLGVLTCTITYVDAEPVYVRLWDAVSTEVSLLVPAVRFAGQRELALQDGSIQVEEISDLVLRVGDQR